MIGGFAFGLLIMFGVIPIVLVCLIRTWRIPFLRWRDLSLLLFLTLVSSAFVVPRHNRFVVIAETVLLLSGLLAERRAEQLEEEFFNALPNKRLKLAARIN